MDIAFLVAQRFFVSTMCLSATVLIWRIIVNMSGCQ